MTRDKIVKLAGDLPRVELFARQKCPGWDAWGNEVECDLTRPTTPTPPLCGSIKWNRR